MIKIALLCTYTYFTFEEICPLKRPAISGKRCSRFWVNTSLIFTCKTKGTVGNGKKKTSKLFNVKAKLWSLSEENCNLPIRNLEKIILCFEIFERTQRKAPSNLEHSPAVIYKKWRTYNLLSKVSQMTILVVYINRIYYKETLTHLDFWWHTNVNLFRALMHQKS